MTLFETITKAVGDFTTRGYVSPEQLAYWQDQIRKAAIAELVPEYKLAETLRRSLATVYERLVEQGGIMSSHVGVSRFTVDRLRPQTRAELNKRIMASADLIRLNREQAVEKTLQRFSGWASSIPEGGSEVVDKNPTKLLMQKSMRQLPFAERRCLIDQAAKLTSSINDIIAKDGGAIAGVWRSQWRRPGYNYRDIHKKIDGDVFLIKDSWAKKEGLVKPGSAGYVEDHERPAELPFCSCKYQWIYSIGRLPEAMLTAKGKAELARVRAEIGRAA